MIAYLVNRYVQVVTNFLCSVTLFKFVSGSQFKIRSTYYNVALQIGPSGGRGVHFCVFFECVKGFVADIVLNFAGVFNGCFFVDAETN